MITNSVRNSYAGLGSPAASYSRQDQAAASGASTLVCAMPSPVRQGYVRVKTEAPVASFLISAVLGRTNVDINGQPLSTPDQIVLYHGDVATAITGVTTAYVDECVRFQSDRPMFEIDIMITAGAATTISYEVAGGS